MQIYGKIPKHIGEMRLEDLMDLNIFEKYFFGKKLGVKDQLIFRVYARELLDMIRGNINRQIKKKKALLETTVFDKPIARRARSKSPIPGQKSSLGIKFPININSIIPVSQEKFKNYNFKA